MIHDLDLFCEIVGVFGSKLWLVRLDADIHSISNQHVQNIAIGRYLLS